MLVKIIREDNGLISFYKKNDLLYVDGVAQAVAAIDDKKYTHGGLISGIVDGSK